MRNLIALLAAALMLVSHGGFAGASPHGDHSHGHAETHERHHHGHGIGTEHGAELTGDADSSGDLPSSHSAPHGHAVLGMPEAGIMLAQSGTLPLLPAPVAAAPLVGTEAPPLTEPPSA